MRMLLSKSTAVVLLFFFISSCKQPQVGSELSYGHMSEVAWMTNTLFAISPLESKSRDGKFVPITIGICDKANIRQFNGEIVGAFREWLGPYSKFFNFRISCFERHKVFVDPGKTCQTENAIAETLPVLGKITIGTENLSWVIRMCKPKKIAKAVILHEVGHILGQCDRYLDKAEDGAYHAMKGANCDSLGAGTDGKFSEPSAMQVPGDLHPQRVTDDDLRGVKAFLLRKDIITNAPWQEFLDAQMPGWRQ